MMRLLFALICIVFDLVHAQERLESLKSCWSDSDCYANSFCFNNDANRKGNCKCFDNHVLWRKEKEYECHLPAKYNEPCIRDVQCKVNYSLGKCNEGVCGCEADAHFVNNFCYKTAGLEESCVNDYNCRAIDQKNMFCDDGKCRCRYNYHLNSHGVCVYTARLGGRCEDDESCASINARCLNGMCTCMLGYVQSTDLQVCLKAAMHFGAPCQQLSQCDTHLEGAKCIDAKCSCSSDHHIINPKCYKTVAIDGICNSDNECQLRSEYIGRVECIDNRCRCLDGADRVLDVCTTTNRSNRLSGNNNDTLTRLIVYLIALNVSNMIFFI